MLSVVEIKEKQPFSTHSVVNGERKEQILPLSFAYFNVIALECVKLKRCCGDGIFHCPVCFCVVAYRLRHSALPTRNARHRFGKNGYQPFYASLSHSLLQRSWKGWKSRLCEPRKRKNTPQGCVFLFFGCTRGWLKEPMYFVDICAINIWHFSIYFSSRGANCRMLFV